MRPATFSTENPPQPITCVETLEYIAGLRRRIEVQNDQMEQLADQVQQSKKKNDYLVNEVEKLSLDLGIKDGIYLQTICHPQGSPASGELNPDSLEEVPHPGWTEVPK
jgi:ABC-type multidrug transport system ATPase subunit